MALTAYDRHADLIEAVARRIAESSSPEFRLGGWDALPEPARGLLRFYVKLVIGSIEGEGWRLLPPGEGGSGAPG